MKSWQVMTLVGVFAVLCARPAVSSWDNYTVADGLANSSVWAIVEDNTGNLWFGTSVGVSRYDGVGWETYTTADGLASNSVWAIVEDRTGNLWFGTYGMGVSRYDGENWVTFTRADGLAHNDVRAILEDSVGNLWFGTGGGVSRYDGVSWKTFTTADGLIDDFVVALLEDHAGTLWFGTYSAGVSCYDGTNWTTYTSAEGLADDMVREILEDSAGDLWFGTYGGVSRYDGVSWKTYTTADGLAYGTVYDILEDSAGDLWFGTSFGGVSRYDGLAWETYTTADGLVNNAVREIIEDSAGNLWFGTYGGGVSRNDGVAWKTFTTADSLADNDVWGIVEDDAGNLWFGTHVGVCRYDGVSWKTYRMNDSLAYDYVNDVFEDGAGNIWAGTQLGAARYDGLAWQTYGVGGGVRDILEDSAGNLWFATDGGVSRYDGVEWRTYTTVDGLVSDNVWAITEDRVGDFWFGTHDGVSRYDGTSWVTYTTADGLVANYVDAILEDRAGNLWFGTFGGGGGVSRYDGVSWRTFTGADGLVSNFVLDIAEDRAGSLWFATTGGVSRYDGVHWVSWTSADGLAGGWVTTILEDGAGDFWFGTHGGGVTRYTPDRVPPQTVMRRCPPKLSASTTQSVDFAAGFREAAWITFSYSLDGGSWSEWGSSNLWFGTGLTDGEHVFMARARDRVGNADSTAGVCRFEIDATPPMPLIAFPSFGSAVRDSVVIRGKAADERFKRWRIDVSPAGADSWESVFESSAPMENGALCVWNTLSLADGDYDLRLSVTDTVGLIGFAFVGVTVDNHAPWAYETTPAMVSTVNGGHVYTTNSEVHLYFPPHAFVLDTQVGIEGLSDSDVPDTLESGVARMLPGYEISWEGAVLEKPATLEMSYAEWESASGDEAMAQAPAYALPALYVMGADSTWRRVGGTVDEQAARICAAITEPGCYALFLEPPGSAGTSASTLSALSLTPRVFAPNGTFANDHAAIGFTLGRSAPVTVKVYNRAGRLVRELVSGETMGAGANIVRWDGRDGDANLAGDGLYLIVVDALGQKQSKTIGVVR